MRNLTVYFKTLFRENITKWRRNLDNNKKRGLQNSRHGNEILESYFKQNKEEQDNR